jgi:hypothetical protein
MTPITVENLVKFAEKSIIVSKIEIMLTIQLEFGTTYISDTQIKNSGILKKIKIFDIKSIEELGLLMNADDRELKKYILKRFQHVDEIFEAGSSLIWFIDMLMARKPDTSAG